MGSEILSNNASMFVKDLEMEDSRAVDDSRHNGGQELGSSNMGGYGQNHLNANANNPFMMDSMNVGGGAQGSN